MRQAGAERYYTRMGYDRTDPKPIDRALRQLSCQPVRSYLRVRGSLLADSRVLDGDRPPAGASHPHPARGRCRLMISARKRASDRVSMDQCGDAALLSICGVEDKFTPMLGLAWCVLITPDIRRPWALLASTGSGEPAAVRMRSVATQGVRRGSMSSMGSRSGDACARGRECHFR